MLEKKSLEVLKKINENSYIISDPHFFHDKVFLFEKSRLDLILEHPDIPKEFVKIIKDFQQQDNDNTFKRISDISKDLIIFHNEMLIKNWNNEVQQEDIVICLGDFAWKGIQEIIPYLNGNKILILGNHDRSGENTYPKITVIRGLINIVTLDTKTNEKIIMKEFDNSDGLFSSLIIDNWIFSHYPISEFEMEISKRGNRNNALLINSRINKLMKIVNFYPGIKINFHGHTHSRNINPYGEEFGLTYINSSCEKIDFKPKKIKDLLND